MIQESKIKHLEFIQNIINRMNSNSFMIKGWMITILSAILALHANKPNSILPFIAIISTSLFWGLDAYYLQQERKFRCLYHDVVKDIIIEPFNMCLKQYSQFKQCRYSNVLLSKTLLTLYCPIIICLLLFEVYLNCSIH